VTIEISTTAGRESLFLPKWTATAANSATEPQARCDKTKRNFQKWFRSQARRPYQQARLIETKDLTQWDMMRRILN